MKKSREKKKMKRVQNMFPRYRFNQFLKNHRWKVINISAISNNNNFIALRRSCTCSHYLVNTSCANVNFPRICAHQMRITPTTPSKHNRISNKCIPNPKSSDRWISWLFAVCPWKISFVIFPHFHIDAIESQMKFSPKCCSMFILDLISSPQWTSDRLDCGLWKETKKKTKIKILTYNGD